MQRVPLRLAAMIGLLPLAAGLAGGCDTEEGKADLQVQRLLAEAAVANQPARIPTLTKAADFAGQSASSKVHAKDFVGDEELAAARVDAAAADTYAATVGQLINDVNRMTADIAESTRLAATLQQLEPVASRESIGRKIKEINEGDEGQWIAPLAAQSALAATVADLTKRIAEGEAKIKGLTEQQAAAVAEAERLSGESVEAKGQASVDLYKQASAKRKEAMDLTSQLDVAGAAQVPLQQDLGIAQEQERMRADAVARFEAQGKTIDEGWTNVQAAQAGLASGAQAIVSGDAKTTAGSLTQAGAQLETAVKEYDRLVGSAVAHFELAQAHYGSANTEAEKQLSALATLIGEQPESPDVTAYKSAQNTLTPPRFEFKKGLALQGQALLLARRAELMTAQSNAQAALGPVLQAASLQAPAGLNAGDLATPAKEAVTRANDAFAAAVESLGGVSQAGGSTPSGQDAKRAATVALMLTEYAWSQFATATGDANAARNHLAAAVAARGEATADEKTVLPVSLPADLAPPRAAAAPATAPSAAQ